MTAADALKELHALADGDNAQTMLRFFKADPRGQGDQFIGVKTQPLRKLAKALKAMPLAEVEKLLHSPIHEARQLALQILVVAFPKADAKRQQQTHELYLANTAHVNNWDLVDGSAEYLVGAYLQEKPRKLLDKLARSKSLWERRIAMVSTRYFIKQRDFVDALRLAERLLEDQEDLMHKAVGWMLKEIGERDREVLEAFLQTHYRKMPRTMLRYAIEKFPEARRQQYLKGTV